MAVWKEMSYSVKFTLGPKFQPAAVEVGGVVALQPGDDHTKIMQNLTDFCLETAKGEIIRAVNEAHGLDGIKETTIKPVDRARLESATKAISTGPVERV